VHAVLRLRIVRSGADVSARLRHGLELQVHRLWLRLLLIVVGGVARRLNGIEAEGTVPRYLLPDLLYDYGALEPHISGKIMELHHDKHHRNYVLGANRAVDQIREARQKGQFDSIVALEHALAFNVSGHVLHSIFWQNMSPDGGDVPNGPLRDAIQRDFGSFDRFKQQLTQVAMTVMGSGWAALIWDPLVKRLGTTQIHDHQSEITPAGLPLLVLDAWEHAYYLQYHNDKERFFKAVWDVWNWDDVSRRFLAVQNLDLGLREAAEHVAPEPSIH
jgi:Fe-Mn family superoxide dismutase